MITPRSTSLRPLALLLALAALSARADVVISFLHAPPVRGEEGSELAITGEMFGGSELEAAEVIFRARGERGWHSAPLVPSSGFSWRAVIPGALVRPPALEYWVAGTDGFGERRAVFASEAEPQRIPVRSVVESYADEQRSGAPRAVIVPSARGNTAVALPELPAPPDAGAPAGPSPLEEAVRTLQASVALPPSENGSLAREASADAGAPLPSAPLAAQGPAASPLIVAAPAAPAEALSTSAANPPSAPASPSAAAPSAPAPGPNGLPQPQRKNRRNRPADLSLFAPDDPAALADGFETPPGESPGLSTVLGEELLKSLGARTAGEALRFVPGLFVTTDALGFSTVSQRGLRDDAGVLVLYDGQRTNSAVDGRALLELPTENLERIEVLRGPAAARYGSGALLAVINLVPRRKDGVTVALAGESEGAVALDFHGGGQLARIQLDGDMDLRAQSPGGAAIAQDAWTQTLRAQGLLGADAPAGALDDSGLLFNAGSRLVAQGLLGGDLELKLRFVHEKRGVHLGEGEAVGGEPTLGGADASAIQRDLLLADLGWSRSYGAVQLAAHAFGSTRQETRAVELVPPGTSISGQGYPAGVHSELEWSESSAGFDLGGRVELGGANGKALRAELKLGLSRDWVGSYQSRFDVGESGAPLGALAPTALPLAEDQPGLSGRTDLFAQLQAEWRPLPPLLVLLGLRLDELPGADAASCGGAPCLDSSLDARPSVGEVSPDAALVYTLAQGATLKLLGGRGFRAATLDELSSRPQLPAALLVDQIRGAQGLAPEESSDATLAFDWTGAMADGRGHLRAAGSLTDLDNAIAAADAGDHLQLFNDARPLRAFSLELEGKLESSRRSWQMLALTWTRARDLNAGQGVWLLRDLPQVRAVLAAAAPLGAWLNAIAWLEGDSARENDQRDPLEAARAYAIPASAFVQLTLRTEPLWQRLELALTLRDLLGAATPDDVPRPDLLPGLIPGEGFSASLTARARF